MGQPGGPGGAAIGLRIEDATELTSKALTVDGIAGAQGGLAFKWGDGRQGGLAAGVTVSGSA